MARIILVGGGSSSGKSYVTNTVIENLHSDEITRITIDDFYKDQSQMSMEERVNVNYDHPKAFDWKLMIKQIMISPFITDPIRPNMSFLKRLLLSKASWLWSTVS